MPDLNSLPPSRSIPVSTSVARTTPGSDAAALRGQSPSPLSRSTSTSLQAAAAVNAGLRQEDSRRSSSSSVSRNRQPSHSNTGRRRSTILMNLQLNDPSLPGPGEMVSEGSALRTGSPNSITSSPIIPSRDPHHYRTPSLGEIHQELEQEQEAQVNRLLQMIRVQQQQLQQLQATGSGLGSSSVIDESTPTSEQSIYFASPNTPHAQLSSAVTPRSPTLNYPRASVEIARADIQRRSRTPSRTDSPDLRSTSISAEAGDVWNLGGRDESAFYQAETQMMVRENQMLRQRIRELERQVTELHANSALTHEPASPSNLLRSTSVSEELAAPTSAQQAGTEDVKEE